MCVIGSGETSVVGSGLVSSPPELGFLATINAIIGNAMFAPRKHPSSHLWCWPHLGEAELWPVSLGLPFWVKGWWRSSDSGAEAMCHYPRNKEDCRPDDVWPISSNFSLDLHSQQFPWIAIKTHSADIPKTQGGEAGWPNQMARAHYSR